MLHSHFMILISVLFLIVSLAILVSLIRHHRIFCAQEAKAFGGPTGRVQWLWALVPLFILGSINYALITMPVGHDHRQIELSGLRSSNTPSVSPVTTTLPFASAPDATTPSKGLPVAAINSHNPRDSNHPHHPHTLQ